MSAPQIITWDGQPISVPGIYRGVGIDGYHQQLTVGPSISSSGLRVIFNESPAHYFRDSYLNPNRAERKESEAFIFGRASHHRLLGEANFDRYFVVRPEELNGKPWNGNRTDCREWLAVCREAGLTILTPAQRDAIVGMARGLAENPLVQAGILNGLVEHSMVWRDKETGIWLKVRPDVIPTDAADFSDLKSCADITDDGIERAIGDHGLNMQGALVGMGCREIFDREMETFSLVFSEKTEPHVARVKTLKPADLELGERQVRATLRQFAHCLEAGHWPGPGGQQTDAEYVEIKPYRRTAIEHRLAQLDAENDAAPITHAAE
jgi:hypothetical protein